MSKVINQTSGNVVETHNLFKSYLNLIGLKHSDWPNCSGEKSDLTLHVIW